MNMLTISLKVECVCWLRTLLQAFALSCCVMQTARQEASLDQLFSTDRQSLLDEIAEHRTLANNMKNETVQILGRLERHKAEALQQGELVITWSGPTFTAVTVLYLTCTMFKGYEQCCVGWRSYIVCSYCSCLWHQSGLPSILQRTVLESNRHETAISFSNIGRWHQSLVYHINLLVIVITCNIACGYCSWVERDQVGPTGNTDWGLQQSTHSWAAENE